MTGPSNCPLSDDDVKAGGDYPTQSHGYKPLGRRYPETSVGWYRRDSTFPRATWAAASQIEFDGAFRSVLVFVNGCFVGRNDNGYAPFGFDLTDFLVTAAQRITSCCAWMPSFGDGWFYEGAGIYRHVWLTKTDALHLGSGTARCARLSKAMRRH